MIEVLTAIKAQIESLHGTEVFNALAPLLPAIDDAIEKAQLSQGIGERPWCEGPYTVTLSKEDPGTFHIRGPMGPPTRESAPYTALVLQEAPEVTSLMLQVHELLFPTEHNPPQSEAIMLNVDHWHEKFANHVRMLKAKEK